MKVKEKSVVTMKLDGNCASHSRTDVSARDVRATIDEPAERGGSNQGLTPTETLMASLIGCTNVIARRSSTGAASRCRSFAPAAAR